MKHVLSCILDHICLNALWPRSCQREYSLCKKSGESTPWKIFTLSGAAGMKQTFVHAGVEVFHSSVVEYSVFLGCDF
jgi:hypothetical protein